MAFQDVFPPKTLEEETSLCSDNDDMNSQLLEAVSNEELTEVKELLKKGSDVNTKGCLKDDSYKSNPYTPLILAAERGFERLVKVLLEVPGIEVNQTDKYGYTALHEAARSDSLEVVEELLANPGIDVNIADRKYNFTPLHSAAKRGYTDVVKALLKAPNIQINKKLHTAQTPLHLAAQDGEVEIVKALLETPGILVNEQETSNGHTALHLATDLHHTETVRALLNHPDINVNIKDAYGQTPLHTSAYHGNLTVVKMLLEAGINAKEKTVSGHSAVHFASKRNHVGVVEMIIEYLQDPSPFRVRKQARDKEIADISQRARVSQKPQDEGIRGLNNQLLTAAKYGELDKVEGLLAEPGIDVNCKDRYENTPLHWASAKGHLKVVETLLKRGVSVNAKSKDKRKCAYPVHLNDNPNRAKLDIGKTPLLVAVEGGHVEVVKLLLSHGEIDVNAKDKYDACPLVAAVKGGYTEIVKLLMTHPRIDVKVKDTCNDHFTLLHLAIDRNNTTIAKMLLDHPDIQVNQKDMYYKSTPLHYAVSKNKLSMVKILLKHPRVDVNEKDKYFRTPLIVAERKGNSEIIQALSDHSDIKKL